MAPNSSFLNKLFESFTFTFFVGVLFSKAKEMLASTGSDTTLVYDFPTQSLKFPLTKANFFFLSCEGCVVSRLPPPGFELQFSRLPGKGGYSTRPSGTTSSLVILVWS